MSSAIISWDAYDSCRNRRDDLAKLSLLRKSPRRVRNFLAFFANGHFLPIGVDRISVLCHNPRAIRFPSGLGSLFLPSSRVPEFPSLLATGSAVKTSLVYLVLALSSSWNDNAPAASDTQAFGPTPEFFANAEPYGLFDELLDQVSEEEVAVQPSPSHRDEAWHVIASRNGASIPTTRPEQRRFRWFPSVLRAQRDQQLVIRAQNVLLADGDSEVPRPAAPRTYSEPAPSQPITPYEEPTNNAPVFTEPAPIFTPPPATAPPPAVMPGASTWGANGPQPYRLGYSLWSNVGWLPERPVSNGDGRLEVFEFNMGLNHTVPTCWAPWLFSLQHEFNYRAWEGPTSVDLPGSVYRFGWDFRLETPTNSPYAPWSALLAFNPSINSDFDHSLTREAWNFDGRGIVFFQADPYTMIALGAGFWDRVHDHVIPYAGVVWQPDGRWEIRAMFPESRISVYMGNFGGEDVWFYVNGEYHIESYQIGTTSSPGGRGQIEMEDWRIVFGCRKSSPVATGFCEAGWVFGRKAELRHGPDFDINTGFIGRLGFRF